MERSNRSANMFPIIVYAFMAHDHRRVCNARPRPPPARRACLDDDGVLLRRSTVARPAPIRRVGLPYRARRARCNHPVSPVRQRGPNSTRMPRASHPASTRPRSCCRSTAAAIAWQHVVRQRPRVVVLGEAALARDPCQGRRVRGQRGALKTLLLATSGPILGRRRWRCPRRVHIGRDPMLADVKGASVAAGIAPRAVPGREDVHGEHWMPRGQRDRADEGVGALGAPIG